MWWHTVTHGRGSEGGNWRMEWVASTLHTTSEHDVSSISTTDAHTSAASSRLNWCPQADLNVLVRFAERQNLVYTRVPLHFSWPLAVVQWCIRQILWIQNWGKICHSLFLQNNITTIWNNNINISFFPLPILYEDKGNFKIYPLSKSLYWHFFCSALFGKRVLVVSILVSLVQHVVMQLIRNVIYFFFFLVTWSFTIIINSNLIGPIPEIFSYRRFSYVFLRPIPLPSRYTRAWTLICTHLQPGGS